LYICNLHSVIKIASQSNLLTSLEERVNATLKYNFHIVQIATKKLGLLQLISGRSLSSKCTNDFRNPEIRIPDSHHCPTNMVLDFGQVTSDKILNRNEIRISILLLPSEDVTHSLCLDETILGFL